MYELKKYFYDIHCHAFNEDKYFETFSFLGINARCYKQVEVKGLLAKYFSDQKRDCGATTSLSKPLGLCEAHV